MSTLRIAILGCGSRGRTYAKIAAALAPRYTITAAADHHAVRRDAVVNFTAPHPVQTFSNETEFFAAGKLADVLIIGTQDAQHFSHVTQALKLGYDVLLEKPAAETLDRCEEIDTLAKNLKRRVALCFVLRYTPFYSTVKSIIDSGKLGKIISIRTHEGVEPYHQAHSFVRGHWRSSAESTPMIVAKCSHDADMLCWLANSHHTSLSSYGDRSWFRSENAPASAPNRCTDGCPASSSCDYDAHRYLTDKRRWLGMVMDGADDANDQQILDFLHDSPWGRCVYHCDNDVVDHQVLACTMANGITATHTMTAFDFGRAIEIYGTKAALKGGHPYHEAGAPELWLRHHKEGTIEPIEIVKPTDEGYAGHGGGDFGLMDSLDHLFAGENPIPFGLDGIHGHRLAFLAELSRLQGKSITESPQRA